MREHAVVAVLLWCAVPAFGQSLVPNPGFESYTLCPSVSGEPYDGYVDDWTTPTNATSNYFNACTSGQWSVPGGAFFSPLAHGGEAYSGLYTYASSTDYREYIEAALTAPLEAGKLYAVSFWVYRAIGSRYGVERIGAHFSLGSVGPTAGVTVLPLTPQVESPAGTVLDGGWIKISGTFVAAGGEDHIVIGSFVDDTGTVTGDFAPCSCVDGAYYYVDDVTVSRSEAVPLPLWSSGMLAALTLLGLLMLRRNARSQAGLHLVRSR